MLKRVLAIAVLAALAAACNPAGTPVPTLSLSTPTSSEMPVQSTLPLESTQTSP